MLTNPGNFGPNQRAYPMLDVTPRQPFLKPSASENQLVSSVHAWSVFCSEICWKLSTSIFSHVRQSKIRHTSILSYYLQKQVFLWFDLVCITNRQPCMLHGSSNTITTQSSKRRENVPERCVKNLSRSHPTPAACTSGLVEVDQSQFEHWPRIR